MVALAPKTQAEPKQEDNWFSFTPLKKAENRAKTENIFEVKSLIGEPKRKSLFDKSEPQKAPAEQIHEEKSNEQQSLNLLERKQKNLPLPPRKPEYSFEKDPDYELIMRNIKRMKNLEGVKPYGYKDTKDTITVAEGVKANTREAYHAFDWRNQRGEKASYEEVDADYDNLRGAPSGQLGSFYENLTKCRLPEEEMHRKPIEHIKNDMPQIRRNVKNFDRYPKQIQDVIIDIQYNTGHIERFPNFLDAVERKDLGAMIKESYRPDVQADRNQEIINLLKSIKNWDY